MSKPSHEGRYYRVRSIFCGEYELRALRDPDGKNLYVAVLIAKALGFSAYRDVSNRLVPPEHRALIGSPVAPHVAGNPKTKIVTVIDEIGVRYILGNCRNGTVAQRERVAESLRLLTRSLDFLPPDRIPSLFDDPPIPEPQREPEKAGAVVPAPQEPPPFDETLILSQALEIANRKLSAAKVKHYPPNHLFTATEIGTAFGLSAVALNKILEREKVQYSVRRDGRSLWLLCPEYRGQALAWVRDVEKNGHLVPCLLWTWKGKQIVESVVQKAGVPKKDD